MVAACERVPVSRPRVRRVRRCARADDAVTMAAAALLWCWLLLLAAAHALDEPPTDARDPPTRNHTKPDSRCGEECVRCAADGCVRCARLLVWPGGECARACPAGSREAWARGDRLMGRVCYPDDYYNEALIGGCAGAALCIALAACGAAYARCRRSPRALPRPRPLPQAPPPDEESARLRDFHKQLDCLRPHAYTLLSILNNTRRQVRELYLLGNNDAAMAYSCVLSDLAKLLLLLNKSHVPVVPDEWPRLASWAERILRRYSRVTGIPQQTHQLASFLQPPGQLAENRETRQPFSTFKPPSYGCSSMSYSDDLFDKEFEIQCQWSEELRPPSYSLLERECVPLATAGWGGGGLTAGGQPRALARRESVWLEDEELKLARPQDELTTEL